MKKLAALAISVSMLFAQKDRVALRTVTGVRTTSNPGVTRVAVEVSGDFKFRSDRLHDPERIYFDILSARPRIESKPLFSQDVKDALVLRVRVAETQPGTTRIVLDLAGEVAVSTSRASNPTRLVIELRAAGAATPAPTSTAPTSTAPTSTQTAPAQAAPAPTRTPAPVVNTPTEPVPEPEAPKVAAVRAPSPKPVAAALPVTGKTEPEPVRTEPEPVIRPEPSKTEPAKSESAKAEPAPSEPAKPPAAKRAIPKTEPAPVAARVPVEPPPPPPATPGPAAATTTAAAANAAAEAGKAARHTSTGGNSLTRALGLKISRIVIDAGHGGHDQGTEGPHGLLEKELVLDVALRVGKLVEERMNAEVIYTRSDDTFVPLEGRTAIANQKKADLFLSIHANSSPLPRISGVETFYLNFTDSKDALDVASRENASSQKSIFELQDIIQKITLHEKLDESREFAGRIQASLYSLSSRNVPAQKNRGVKKAPFVVLIGASMPSVLAEIGFVSNLREEALLKKSDYRQKLAESLYRGLSRYAESLSHFQMAQN